METKATVKKDDPYKGCLMGLSINLLILATVALICMELVNRI